MVVLVLQPKITTEQLILVPHSMLLLIVIFSLPTKLVIFAMLEWEIVVYPRLWVLEIFT